MWRCGGSAPDRPAGEPASSGRRCVSRRPAGLRTRDRPLSVGDPLRFGASRPHSPDPSVFWPPQNIRYPNLDSRLLCRLFASGTSGGIASLENPFTVLSAKSIVTPFRLPRGAIQRHGIVIRPHTAEHRRQRVAVGHRHRVPEKHGSGIVGAVCVVAAVEQPLEVGQLVAGIPRPQAGWIWRDRATKAIDSIKGESVSSG